MSTNLPLEPARRRFIRSTTGAMILGALPLAACTSVSSTPDSAVAAWLPSAAESDPRKLALSYAILAPNPHNRQPWLVDLTKPDEIAISIDTKRLLPDTDPFGRQILIGTGAMLGLLELAAAHFGYQTRTTLFENAPFGDAIDSRTVARVRFEKTGSAKPAALFEQILKRRTVRSPYDSARLPSKEFTEQLLARSSDAFTFSVTNARDQAGEAISKLAKSAWLIELSTPRTVMESMHLLRVGSAEIDKHRDGLTINEPMLVMLDKIGLLDRSAPPKPDSTAFRSQIEKFDAAIDSTPAYLALTSRANTRVDQLEAGRQYVMAQLLAAQFGLVMHPVSQGLQEYPEMAQTYRQVHQTLAPAGATIQMLCRIGYLPAGAAMPRPSPRRGVAAHLRA